MSTDSAATRYAKTSYFETRRFRSLVLKTVVSVILICGSIIFLMPVLWMLSTSLKNMKEIMHYPPSFIPEHVFLSNFVNAWKTAPFTRYTLNTLFLTFFVVVGQVASSSYIAYGFAKIRFRGRGFLFGVVLATMMLPAFVMLIPQYILFAKIHWINSYLPLIVPKFFGSSFFIFLNRQFLMGIPNELVEAAKIDGASHFYIWLRLMTPLTKPVLATTAIITFDGSWNDLLGPLLYVNSESLYTLQIGLATFRGTVQTQWNYLMAASLLVLLPVIVLFFVFQRYFIQGMNLTAGSKY